MAKTVGLTKELIEKRKKEAAERAKVVKQKSEKDAKEPEK